MNRNAAQAAWQHPHAQSSPNPFQPRQEPVEAPHIADANAALDQVEVAVKQIIDAGGEFALRQRLGRLLP